MEYFFPPELPSPKSYILRALYEWCCDNGLTPHVAVAVDNRTVVPREHVRDGQIVLNISQDATHRLNIGDDYMEFSARFNGAARELSIPVANILAIYARENGAGMAFDFEPPQAESDDDQASPVPGVPLDTPVLAPVANLPASDSGASSPDDSTPPPAPAGGRPRLTRVK